MNIPGIEVLPAQPARLDAQPIPLVFKQFTCEHDWGTRQRIMRVDGYFIGWVCKDCKLARVVEIDQDDKLIEGSGRELYDGGIL